MKLPCATHLVILCAPGQAPELLARLRRWLSGRGLQLNEQKTRQTHCRDGFQFLGFTLRYQKSRRTGRWYPHVEPSSKSQQKFREMVRGHLNHWTKHRRTADVVTELNRSVRGWSGYFHRLHSTRVFGKLRWWTNDRMRRWLWRKHQCTRALWTDYPDSLLHGRYGLWPLPLRAAWR